MRTKKGVVTSVAMNKTIVVTIHTYKNDPKYKKRYRVTRKFHAHDEENSCQIWDIVIIKETRPLSKLKRWKLLEKIS